MHGLDKVLIYETFIFQLDVLKAQYSCIRMAWTKCQQTTY